MRPSSGNVSCRNCFVTVPGRALPDGRLFAFGRENEILILDTETLADVTSWQTASYDNPFGFAWLDGGATLAHGGIEGRLAFRSIPDGQPIGEPREVLPGSRWTWPPMPTRPGWRPSARTARSSSGTRRRSRRWARPWIPSGDTMWGWIWFGSDDRGEFIEVQYDNAPAVRYPVDTETLISRACAIAGREPTTAEWQAMHGDAPQRPTCGALTEGDLLADRLNGPVGSGAVDS